MNALQSFRGRAVVVVVGEMRLRREDVQLLHMLVTVDAEWTLVELSHRLKQRYGSDWYRQKVGRSLDKLRRNGLVESDGYDTVRDAVVAVAELKAHNPSTGVLWREIGKVLEDTDVDPLEFIRRKLREAGL